MIPFRDYDVVLIKMVVMKISRELKIGVFVIAVLAVSFFVINFLRGKDIMNREMEVVSEYGDVLGLVVSDPVYIKGYKAGSVTGVDYDPDAGVFRVSCSVLKQFRIPEDSKMVIYSRDVMGSKAIRIEPGLSGTVASEGERLEPEVEPDIFASVSGALNPLVARFSHTLESIDSVAVSLGKVMDRDTRERIDRTLADLERTVADARRLSSAIGGKSAELEAFIENMASVSARLDSVTEKADSAMTDIADVASGLSQSDIEGLVMSFRTLVDSMQDPEGSFGKLLTDDGLYLSLDSLVSQADSLIRKIQENPKKYVRISLF